MPSPDLGSGARHRWALAGMAVFVMSVLVLGWSVRVMLASAGLEPAGPTCGYEIDEGSGPAGFGTERLDWGWWPSQVCVTETGEVFRGGAVDSTSPLQPDLMEPENAPWWIGAVGVVLGVSAAAAGLAAWWAHRRSRRVVAIR